MSFKRGSTVYHPMSSCFLVCFQQPTILEVVPKEQSVATKTDVKFSVKATGDCLHFQWKKNSEVLFEDRQYRGTKTDTLCIKDVEKNEKGIYQCLVSNDVGEKLSEEADLAVSKLVVKIFLLIP